MLRSTEKVRNVSVSATDGLLGKIDHFLFDSRLFDYYHKPYYWIKD